MKLPAFRIGDRVEISVVCIMAPCTQPQGTVVDATVRVEDRAAVFQGPGAVIRVVPEGTPLHPAETVYLVKVREDGSSEDRWMDVRGLRKIAGTSRDIRDIQPFSGEENISPWGWFAVGTAIAGVMGLGAWFVTRPGLFEMAFKTLNQLISENIDDSTHQHSEYVREPGFKPVYVRVGAQFIEGQFVPNTVTIANIVATRLGKGAFTKLSARLHDAGHNVYVECVQNPRFAEKLRRLGYREIPSRGCPSFFLPVEFS